MPLSVKMILGKLLDKTEKGYPCLQISFIATVITIHTVPTNEGLNEEVLSHVLFLLRAGVTRAERKPDWIEYTL